ncbi:MAG: prepilin-type N-terminal cleavage/methylation domain-containing protein [Deltaproteobacteria bacterium]|nr:prepilin-type N-terminal cleavage/methylation domain-containing protein [Deltaproteobacteria bacterium]
MFVAKFDRKRSMRRRYSTEYPHFSRLPRQSCQAGFSLVEVMVVVGIISLGLAWGGYAMFRNLPDYRLRAAARSIVSDMQDARMQAVKRGQDWAIVFNPGASSYNVCRGRGPDDAWGTADDDVARTVNLSQNFSGVIMGFGMANRAATAAGGAIGSSVTFQNNRVVFDRRGRCNVAGFVYIQQSPPNTHLVYAVGARMTGTVLMYRWGVNDWIGRE